MTLPPEMAELREALGDDMRRGDRWPIGPSARATIIALLDEYEARGKTIERLDDHLSDLADNYSHTRHAAEQAEAALRKSEECAAELAKALGDATKAENSNARRMREAIVEARRHLAPGRALWNGPCVQCDGVLEQALRADNDAEAIARATLTKEPE